MTPRWIAGPAAAALLVSIGCGRTPDTPASIDLVAELPRAERRAAADVDEAVRAASDGESVLLLRAPARVTWILRIPRRAALTASAALAPESGGGVRLRAGISDGAGRYYEGLATLPLTASSPQPVEIDLGKYAGWQWSLFYRPSTMTWRLIVNADATPGGVLVLRAPVIRQR